MGCGSPRRRAAGCRAGPANLAPPEARHRGTRRGPTACTAPAAGTAASATCTRTLPPRTSRRGARRTRPRGEEGEGRRRREGKRLRDCETARLRRGNDHVTRRTGDVHTYTSRRDDNLTVFSKESRRVRSEPSARGCSSRMVRYASCTSASSAPDGDLGASLDPFSSSMSALRLGVAPDAYSTFHFPLSSGEVAGERVGLADSSASRISPRTALSGAAAVKPSATSALSASFAMLPSSTSSASARSGKAGSGASGSSAAESDGASSTCINGAARSASGEAMGRTASRPPGDSE
mmetsp:Transcript_2703/g.7991  ORF Transcript_2703/g.7991 Transcript_2703/m.7991 type:complete len:293 (-) Transcript_2703:76-954(-)